jgi:hypothetical protein
MLTFVRSEKHDLKKENLNLHWGTSEKFFMVKNV